MFSFTVSYTIIMYDGFGDGWNGNSLYIDGQIYTFESGAVKEIDVGCSGVIYGCSTGRY